MSENINPLKRVWPDTAQGAIDAFVDMSVFKSPDIEDVYPDPAIKGVWGIKILGGNQAIVYLAGYPDPWGHLREYNDFEYEE